MVSRYLVDGILIGGLIVGVLGVFYLSNGLFSDRGNGALRGAFAGVTVLVIMAAAFGSGFWLLAPIQGPTLASTLPQQLQDILNGPVLVLIIVFSGTSMTISLLDAFYFGARGRTIIGRRMGIIVIALTVPALCLLAVSVIFTFPALAMVGFAVTCALGFWYIQVAPSRISKWSPRQMQIIGLILTLIGIATQFIPPLLDLLGIKIV